MTDIEQLAKHPAVVEACKWLNTLDWRGEAISRTERNDEIDRIIAAAVAKVNGERDDDLRNAAKLIERLCYRLNSTPCDAIKRRAADQIVSQATGWLDRKGLGCTPIRVAALAEECEFCGGVATRIEDWGDETIQICDRCSVPGVGQPKQPESEV
jgi:hypothetical protein